MHRFSRIVCLVALSAALATAAVLPARAGSGVESLLKLVPPDWPVVVRMDASSSTASGAYLKQQKEGEHGGQVAGWEAAFNTGLARLMSALGLDVDPDGGLLGWAGETAVMAMDPRDLLNARSDGGAPPVPGVLLAVECRDRQKAERELLELVGSVIRESDPAVQDAGGATVYVWKMQAGDQTLRPAYAIADGFVLMADSAERIKQVLESPREALPAAAGKLELHPDALMAFAVDLSPVMAKLLPAQGEGQGQDFLSAMFGMLAMRAGAHGGLSVSEEGILMDVQGEIPPVLMGMLGPMLGGEASRDDIAALLPGSTLAMVSTGSPGLLKPMMERLGGETLQNDSPPDVQAAVRMLSLLEEGTAGIALTGLIPRPNYVLICKGGDASGLLARFRDELSAAGMRAAREPQALRAEIYRITRAEDGRLAGYAGALDGSVFFSSDWRSARKLATVTPATSLAAKQSYADVRTLLGGPRMADMWVSLDAVSALGWLYESMGMSELLAVRLMTDSLKATRGMGLSAGISEGGAEMRMALRTKVGPQAPGLAAYAGALMGALTAGIAGQAVLTGSSEGADVEAEEEFDAAQDSLECLMELVAALKAYAQDHDGRLPDAARWKDALHPYVDSPMTFVCAFEGFTFSYNPKLSGLRLQDIINPQEVVAFAETRPGQWPAPGKFDTPDGKLRLAFLDGRVVEADRVMGNPPKVRARDSR